MAKKQKSVMINNQEHVFSTGHLALQADSCITANVGDTMIMATVTKGKENKDLDFFPLSVEYEEKLYASGKIKTSRFVKREGKPSDDSILRARLIDRAIRPLFDKNYRKEVQIVVTVLSYDESHNPDILGLLAVSLALSISDIPWAGPIGGARIGRIDDEFVLNPPPEHMQSSDLDIILAGLDKKIIMLEAGLNEVKESDVITGFELAVNEIDKICAFFIQVQNEWGKEKEELPTLIENEDIINQYQDTLINSIDDFMKKFAEGSVTRHDFDPLVTDPIVEGLPEESDEEKTAILNLADKLYKKIFRKQILEKEKRPDGRQLDEVRELEMEVGLIPRGHGSSMFRRGETQALNILTLASPSLGQIIENLEGESLKKYMHHYNALPFSVGETGRIGSPGRREIGHGALAEKALVPVIPTEENFPYTIRLVSEILSQNGSSSMASTCASTLSLMDAGVKIKRPVAGVAIGLVTDEESDKFKVLTDIAGIEDFGGDMDFKVTGTTEGITAIQMDTKIHGITIEMAKKTFENAKKGRLHILKAMAEVIAEPREELSAYAPKISTFPIPADDIGKIIGPGGKVIKKLTQEFDSDIDIDDSGSVTICASNDDNLKALRRTIDGILNDPIVGEIYKAQVVRMVDFGVFVEIFPGKEGLVHISRMQKTRTRKPEDVVAMGDKVEVKLLEIDNLGRLNFTMILDEENIKKGENRDKDRNRDRGDRDRDRDRKNKYSKVVESRPDRNRFKD